MESLKQFVESEFLGIPVWTYLASLAAITAGFICKRLAAFVFRRLAKAAERTKLPFDDIAIRALSGPVEWGLVLAGLYAALSILPLPAEPVNVQRFVEALITAATVWLVIWCGTRLVDGIASWWQGKAAGTESKLDDQLVPIVRRSLKAFLYIIGVVLVLQNLGYSVGSLLAGLGIGGVAVAMAAKDTVANLFGSLVVFLDKPFRIGDWIEMGDIEGTVEEVGLRTTRIRTFANSLITLPNSQFTTTAINNWSRMKKRRIKMTLGVTYSSSPDAVRSLVVRIREIIAADENIRDDFYLVNLDNFGPSSIDIFIYCFTNTTNWGEFLEAKQQFMLQLMRAVDELGLEFAFPTQTLHVESLPGEPPAPAADRPR